MKAILKGIRRNNLFIEHFELPLNKTVFLIGPPGSGKSTLSRDILFNEGKRLYLEGIGMSETINLNERQVEYVSSLPPTIYFDQIPEKIGYRKTVGSYSGIERLFYSIFSLDAVFSCPECHIPIKVINRDAIKKEILAIGAGSRLVIMTPLPENIRALDPQKIVLWCMEMGFVRFERRGELFLFEDVLNDSIPIENISPSISIVIDRVITGGNIEKRIEDAIRLIETIGSQVVRCLVLYKNGGKTGYEQLDFSLDMICPICLKDYIGLSVDPLSPLFCLYDKWTYNMLSSIPIYRLKDELKSIALSTSSPHVRAIVAIISEKVRALMDIGLSSLCLNRQIQRISRGEWQRLRLATQIQGGLNNTLVILDEPAIGLHQEDYIYLKGLIKALRKRQNTVLVVEHDYYSLIEMADWVIALGPGSGKEGGRLVFSGNIKEFWGKIKEIMPEEFNIINKFKKFSHKLIKSDDKNNNKGDVSIRRYNIVDVDIDMDIEVIKVGGKGSWDKAALKMPFHNMSLITGRSGSGKTMFLQGVIEPFLRSRGMKVISLDPSAVRGSKYSIIATYLGIFTDIRKLFALTKDARIRGIEAAHFSLTKDAGRCPECKGVGSKFIEMKYISPIETLCPLCKGKRYKREVLACFYKGKNIADVLDMTIEEAMRFFSRIKGIRQAISGLKEVGLEYLRLGQFVSALSGGERIGIKISSLLSKAFLSDVSLSNTAILMDEPSAGLHYKNISILCNNMLSLTAKGATVIIIDKNPILLSHARKLFVFTE